MSTTPQNRGPGGSTITIQTNLGQINQHHYYSHCPSHETATNTDSLNTALASSVIIHTNCGQINHMHYHYHCSRNPPRAAGTTNPKSKFTSTSKPTFDLPPSYNSSNKSVAAANETPISELKIPQIKIHDFSYMKPGWYRRLREWNDRNRAESSKRTEMHGPGCMRNEDQKLRAGRNARLDEERRQALEKKAREAKEKK